MTRAVGLVAVAASLVTLLTGCSIGSTFRGFGWPENGITEESKRMYDLWIASTVAALVVGIFVWGLIFWCVIRYRKRSEEMPLQTRFNLPMEMLYTLTPFLIVSVLFYYTATVQTYVDREVERPDVTVEVLAFKWNWQFNYQDDNARGPGGQPVSTTGSTNYIPVLVLPTNKRVRFVEHSRDVMHSFWVPDMLFKRDVIPGVENRFEVTVVKEGAYVGRCAELCGAYHSMMNFEVRAVSADRFDRYIELRKQGQSTPEALKGIGEPEYAIRTVPFQTDAQQRAAG
ncbi:MAG TPA: cytochrome c oxidase subunit II [Micromonosporaceae bacterium]|nr:cytochrome c oxidase subunit II [Micromonosporaceae bacterium]